MTRRTLIVPSLIAACLAALPLRADAPSPTEQALARENAELKSQVAALRKEVALLRAELTDRQIKIQAGQLRYTLTTRPSTTVVPPPSDLPPGVPESAARRQFNGAPVYVIPLSPSTPPRN